MMRLMAMKPLDSRPIVLIPAYQPGRVLIESTDRLVAANFTVVVVDDGSEADYRGVFSALHKDIRVLRHMTNKGKGAALKTGFRYIRDTFGKYVVITADADGQHHVDDIQKMAADYCHHPYTLLLGVREFESGNVPLRSRFGNVITRKVFSLITKQPLRDTQTGLRAFDDSLMDFMLRVPGERFEYEMNVLLECSGEGIELVELPILTIYENNNQSSHFDPIKDSWAIYKEVIKFASSSLSAFAIDYGMFIILLHLTSAWSLSSSVVFANIVSRITSASFNFLVNKHLVFKHKGNFAGGALQYALLAISILAGNTLLLHLLTGLFHVAPSIAKIVTELTFFCTSYIAQRKIIFAREGAQRA